MGDIIRVIYKDNDKQEKEPTIKEEKEPLITHAKLNVFRFIVILIGAVMFAAGLSMVCLSTFIEVSKIFIVMTLVVNSFVTFTILVLTLAYEELVLNNKKEEKGDE